MSIHVRIVAHTIPNALGIAVPAMVMLAVVEQPVLVTDGFIQTHTGFTVRAVNIPDIFFFGFLQIINSL